MRRAMGAAFLLAWGVTMVAGQGAGAVYVKARLETRIDAHHVKAGDAVRAETLDTLQLAGGVGVPKGSEFDGHIVQVIAAKDAKSRSLVALAFDHVTPKGGAAVATQAAIVAVLETDYDASLANAMNDAADGTMSPQMLAAATRPGTPGTISAGRIDANTQPGSVPARRDSNGVPMRMIYPARGKGSQGTAIEAATGNLRLDEGTVVRIEVVR